MNHGRLVVVEDDKDMRETLTIDLTRRGFVVDAFGEAALAFEHVRTVPCDAVLTDLRMPGMDGLALCERVVANCPELPVVVITSFGNLETAIGAIRAGAFDFVSKPVDFELLAIAIDRAVRHGQLSREVRNLTAGDKDLVRFDELLGGSPPMKRLYRDLESCAANDASVLVVGESGTGKEVVARVLHGRSVRRKGPFCAINCGAVPDNLLESELFGHVRGAFTDARSDRRGVLFQADGGTLFLDEIGECSPAFQVKLLRALEERRARPVGSDRELPFDVRLIAATNRDLESAIEEGRFREDLYFRINVIQLRLPPLRERGSDVLLIAQHFVETFATRSGKDVRGLSDAAAARLLDYGWPGNVRELRNAIERAVALTREARIVIEDLPEKIRAYESDRIVLGSHDPTELVPMAEIERRYITNVLKSVAGNKTAAARVLGFDRKTLYRKIEAYRIDPGE